MPSDHCVMPPAHWDNRTCDSDIRYQFSHEQGAEWGSQPIGITARAVTQISDISFLMSRVQSAAVSNLGVRVSDCKQLSIEK